jgi:hypothetical protein
MQLTIVLYIKKKTLKKYDNAKKKKNSNNPHFPSAVYLFIYFINKPFKIMTNNTTTIYRLRVPVYGLP